MKTLPRLALSCALFFALTGSAWAASGAQGSVAHVPTVPIVKSSAESTTSVVVGFRPDKETEAIGSSERMGAKTRLRSKSGGLAVVEVPVGKNAADFARELSAKPGVRYAEPDTLVYAAMVSTDPGYPEQWGLPKIGAPAAWDVSRGASVTVAVVDTGVSLTHPDLIGHLDTANQKDFVNGDLVAQDDNGHGTHVAGILGAALNNDRGGAGVANQCTILPIKVMNSKGIGQASSVALGIMWAADHGASVINLSLGETVNSASIDSAVQYAVGKDCVVVAAAGNEGSSAVYYPAANANVIGVSATDINDSRASYSNYGPQVDISAPGSDIYSTWWSAGGVLYAKDGGTSMATPFVAGTAALIRAKNPTWTRVMVERQLLGTALDLGAPGRDDFFGYGRVRADLAVGAPTSLGTISGTVIYRGAPLAGVLVSVPDSPAVVTAGDGSYTVPNVIPSTYRVTFSKTGYADQAPAIAVMPGATTTKDVAMSARVALSTPKVVGRASARRGTSLKGAITPGHSTKLTMRVRKLVRHKWRSYRTLSVNTDSAGAWRTKLKLGRAAYSVEVYSAAGDSYEAGHSDWRTVTVR